MKKLKVDIRGTLNKILNKVPLDVPDDITLQHISSFNPEENDGIDVGEVSRLNSNTSGAEIERRGVSYRSNQNSIINSKTDNSVADGGAVVSKNTPFLTVDHAQSPTGSPATKPVVQSFQVYEDGDIEEHVKMLDDRTESVKKLIDINDRRTESMYEMVKKRESVKRKRDSQQMELGKSFNDAPSANLGAPLLSSRLEIADEGYFMEKEDETKNKTSWFGDCYNSIISIFKRG